MVDNHYVYMLRCKDDTLYTGYTNDLDIRLAKHESGKGAKYTRGRGPFILEWVKKYQTKVEAMQQEYQIKQKTRAEKEQWIVAEKEGCQDEDSKEL